jgi:DNA-binding NtrC family response regulator
MARKILIVDDRIDTIWRYLELLGARGYSVVRCSDPATALDVFERERPDAVLLDVKMPGKGGLELLQEIREKDKRVCIIMLSAHGDAGTIVEALKLKADNFADKSYDPEKLLFVIEKELRAKEMEVELAGLKAGRDGRLRTLNDIVGESEAIKAVKRQIVEYADGDMTVFITGECGAGKNVVAEALHTQSKRRLKPFKHLLCTSYQPTLVESELFGYEKGAFTDAYRTKRGVIDTAEDGTVFLDEIGATTPDVQAKLLLLTETGVYAKVGSEGRSQKTDAWFLTATNIDIPKALESGQLRQDLFYRLNQAWINVPPLRERGDDILLLSEYFIGLEAERTGTAPPPMSQRFMDMLLGYPWPGNVRQLMSLIRRYVKSGGKDVRIHSMGMAAAESKGDGNGGQVDFKAALRTEVETVEKKWIVEGLQRFGGNRTKAAEWLGISRRNLMYKIKRYGLHERA